MDEVEGEAVVIVDQDDLGDEWLYGFLGLTNPVLRCCAFIDIHIINVYQ
jgi:hypothetical protein